MIKNWQDFINETYFPDQSDAPEIASDMNRFNDIETQIKEFANKKVTISNIYLTYKDEKDLINKLTSQKFINRTDNKKRIKFTNPILGLWAQSCEKRRDMKDIDDDIKNLESQIKDEESNLKSNPSSKETVKSNIDLINGKIKLKKEEISKKLIDITNSEKLAKTKLSELEKELKLSKKRIDFYRVNKRTQK